jgi:MFS family permease
MARMSEADGFNWRHYLPVLVIAGLGFLVDVYDLLLFAVVRVPSLTDLGVAPNQILSVGVDLINAQMVGLLLGGLIWGVLGDYKGRRAALFGSILIYSFANILNAYVTSVPLYMVLRLIAGIGLAGEVGAAMTIAAEVMPPKYRTYGTAAVSLLGVAGTLLASWAGSALPWRTAYMSAGFAGLALLGLRISMKDTELFEKTRKREGVDRNILLLLVRSPLRLLKAARCVLSALPLFFVFGIIVTFAPEINKNSSSELVSVARVAMFYSIGETAGELLSSILSQISKSRKKVILAFQLCALAMTMVVFFRSTLETYAYLTLPLGFFVGYWALALTTTAEQFGTNVRSTVTTIVPNLMRACNIPLNLTFASLAASHGVNTAVAWLAGGSFFLSIVSTLTMEETFAKDLDFVETSTPREITVGR